VNFNSKNTLSTLRGFISRILDKKDGKDNSKACNRKIIKKGELMGI